MSVVGMALFCFVSSALCLKANQRFPHQKLRLIVAQEPFCLIPAEQRYLELFEPLQQADDGDRWAVRSQIRAHHQLVIDVFSSSLRKTFLCEQLPVP